MNGIDEDMGCVGSYNIKYKFFFFKCVFFNLVFCYFLWFFNVLIIFFFFILSMRRNVLFLLYIMEVVIILLLDNIGFVEINILLVLIIGNISNILVFGGIDE